jgi:hypothetical protein
VEDFLDKTDLDEKITDGAKMLTQKGNEFLDRTGLGEKISSGLKTVSDKAKDVMDEMKK